MPTTRQSSGSRSTCCVCGELPVFNKRWALCKRHDNSIRVYAHRHKLEFSKAVALRANGKPKIGRPQDEYVTAVRKALSGRKSRYSKANGGRPRNIADERKIVKLRKWQDYRYTDGSLGRLHRDSTATTPHRTKPQKLEGSPPKPIPTQKYGPGVVTSVWQRPLDFRPQGKHKYGGGAMLGVSWPGSVTTTPIAYTLDPVYACTAYRKALKRADVLRAYNATKRLHTLGWYPPGCGPEDEWGESVAALAELVPDPEDT